MSAVKPDYPERFRARQRTEPFGIIGFDR